MKIFKYEIEAPEFRSDLADTKYKVQVLLPKGAQILSVGAQGYEMYLWAKVDSEQALEQRSLYVMPTGRDLPEALGTFLGRVDLQSQGLVFHIFNG